MRAWHRTSAPGCTWGSEAPASPRWRWFVGTVFGAVLLTVGCLQIRGLGDAGRYPIVDVQIVNQADEQGEAAVEIADDDLKPTLRRMMASWSDFAFRRARTDEVGWQLTVRLAQLTDRAVAGKADRARSVGFSLKLNALGEVEGERSTYTAEQLLARQEPASSPIIRLVQDALLKAGARLMRFRAIQIGDDEQVVAAIDDPDEAVRLVATQAAGEREIQTATPKLIERLKDTDEAGAVVVSAVGALTALRATNATEAIIDTARRQDRSYVIPLLFALAQLGGRQAQAYLFTVQSGHPDPAVKAAAEKALAELEARLAEP